jgi:hypothetical protein
MGCVNSNLRNKIITPHSIGKIKIRYPRKAQIHIKTKDAAGKQVAVNEVKFNFTRPWIYSAETLNSGLGVHISKCILPGIDPRGESEKICQDLCLYIASDTKILLGLFDGHGKEGEKVVALCVSVLENFFKENSERFNDNPMNFLEEICINCDATVKKSGNNIDSSSSGR